MGSYEPPLPGKEGIGTSVKLLVLGDGLLGFRRVS